MTFIKERSTDRVVSLNELQGVFFWQSLVLMTAKSLKLIKIFFISVKYCWNFMKLYAKYEKNHSFYGHLESVKHKLIFFPQKVHLKIAETLIWVTLLLSWSLRISLDFKKLFFQIEFYYQQNFIQINEFINHNLALHSRIAHYTRTCWVKNQNVNYTIAAQSFHFQFYTKKSLNFFIHVLFVWISNLSSYFIFFSYLKN